MKTIRTLCSSLALILTAACGLPTPAPSPTAVSTPYDAYGPFLDSLMREAAVPGLAFEAASLAELFTVGDALRFANDPGARCRYAGEGSLLLQRAVEQRTGRTLNSLAREYIVGPMGMSRSSFQFDTLVRRNYAFGHDEKRTPDKWRLSAPMSSAVGAPDWESSPRTDADTSTTRGTT